MTEDYGNPPPSYRKGMEAEQYAPGMADIAKTLKVRIRKSCSPPAARINNMALIGTAMANQRAGTSAPESKMLAMVYNPWPIWSSRGLRSHIQSVDSELHFLEELEAAIRPDTILVSTSWRNNEAPQLVERP